MNPHAKHRPFWTKPVRSSISTALALLIFVMASLFTTRAAESLADALQKGLIAEEVNRDLEAAMRAYRTVSTLYDAQRATAATAIFRLGEVLRKQGKASEANTQYQRILTEFGDQTALVKLSRQFLEEKVVAPAEAPLDEVTTRRLEQDLATAEAEATQASTQLDDLKKLSPADLRKVIPATVNDPRLTSLLIKLNETEQKFAASSFDLGAENPEVKRLVATIATIEKQIEATIEGILLGLETKARAADGHVQILRKRLELVGANPRPRNPPLLDPSVRTDEEALELRRVQELARNSPDRLTTFDAKGRTLLQTSAFHGHLEVVRFLLEQGADPNTAHEDTLTALHLAAHEGHARVVELLLKRGAKVDALASAGVTPLHLAAKKGNRAVVQVLLAAQAAPNLRVARDTAAPTGPPTDAPRYTFAAGDDALIAAAASGENATATIQSLLAANADAKWRAGQGSAFETAIGRGHLEAAALLLKAGADPNTAWLRAIQSPDASRLKFLLEHNANKEFNLPSPDGEQGTTPLLAAVRKGALANASALITLGANVNARTSKGSTPLLFAIWIGYTDLAKQLLAAKADPNARDAEGNTLLHHAVRRQRPEIVRLLVASGANTETPLPPDSEKAEPNWTSLFFAAHEQKPDIIDALLQGGAKVNTKTSTGWTPLHAAANAQKPEGAKFLLASGADVNARGEMPAGVPRLRESPGTKPAAVFATFSVGEQGKTGLFPAKGITPLHVAILQKNLEMAACLIQGGADVNLKSGDGFTPLHTAIAGYDYEMTKILLDHKADPNTRDNEDQTILSRVLKTPPLTAWSGVPGRDYSAARPEQLATLLRERGASESAGPTNSPGGAAKAGASAKFTGASDTERREISRLEELLKNSPDLLNEGEMVGTPPQTSGTPLHLAVARNQFHVAKYLLERGANPNVQNYRRPGYSPVFATPLYLTTQATNLAMMEFLVANGADVNLGSSDKTPLQYAVASGNVPVLSLLLKLGANVNVPVDSPPLHTAAQIGHKTIIEMLLAKGANPNAGSKINSQPEGMTPLHLAAQSNYRAVAEALLAGKADANAKNSLGQTPLHLVAASNHLAIAELLITRGANVNATNQWAVTPLYLAAERDLPGMVALLLKNGADPKIGAPSIREEGNDIPTLHFAVGRLNPLMVDFLLAHGVDVRARNRAGFTALEAVSGRTPYYGVRPIEGLSAQEQTDRRAKIEAMLKAKLATIGEAAPK